MQQLKLKKEALQRSQEFRFEDDGHSAAFMMVLDGFRLTQATNESCERIFKGAIELADDAVRYKALQSLIFAS